MLSMRTLYSYDNQDVVIIQETMIYRLLSHILHKTIRRNIPAMHADRLAQLVERRTTEREVSGSSPRPD